MPEVRRSRRQRKSKSHSDDLFKELNIVGSDSERGAESSQQAKHKRNNNNDVNDDDFNISQPADTINVDNSDLEEASDSLEDLTSKQPLEGKNIKTKRKQIAPAPGKRGVGNVMPAQKRPANTGFAGLQQKGELKKETRSRGLIDKSVKSQNKDDIMKIFFGSNPQDWINVLRSRDQWANEPTLPRGKKNGNGVGGMCHHFSHTQKKRDMEASVGWDWYYDHGGRSLFAETQQVRNIPPDEGNEYIPKPMNTSHKILLGPYGNQKVFNLSVGDSLCLDEAWEAPSIFNSNGEEPQPANQRILREGWLINIGTSIKCLDWTPNQEYDEQYLAIATVQPQILDHESLKVSPAYTPLPPLKSCIQIWAFSARETPDQETLLNMREPPELRWVICTEWGEIKQLKWCPMPRSFRDGNSHEKVLIGLLVGIWNDGSVRVLDVQLKSHFGSKASYSISRASPLYLRLRLTLCLVKYDKPAFEAFVPNTLCTCATWLSATDIAVGCANGFLAIWDISTKSPPKTSGTNCDSSDHQHHVPAPWLYLQLHDSYILALAAAYPCQPHLLASSSMDGFMRLTDLRSPQLDNVLSNRSRIASPLLQFSPPILAFISAEENDSLRAHHLRTFYSSVSLARTDAFPLCLSVGHFHPTALVGLADGTLVATNPMRRVMNRKTVYYQQIVLRHEWTRQGGGMSRITEGYKAETVLLQRKSDGMIPGKGAPGERAMSTIYERETGITEVVWNPNLRCGGWAAIGTGSGLVRVQDLAI